MTRTNVGLIVTATALGILLIGGWVAWLVLPTHQAQPSAQTTASTTSEAATSSAALPPPEPVPTYARAGTVTQAGIAVTAPGSAAKTAAVVAPATATLVVDGARFPLHATAGSTLEAAMAQLQIEGGFSYATKTYSGLGSFVTEIQGRASGSGMYWILYVNGKKSSTGISSTRIRSGDLIEWKLEKSY